GGTRDGRGAGVRARRRWRGARVGPIDDLACFVPGEVAETEGDDTGPAGEPVTRMDYLASSTSRNPVPVSADRVVEASREHKLVGLSCPTCGRVYASGNGYCPIDAIPL